ncbi:MAG: Gfo/Idh/MocA family oxidoreductase [Clostridia bacterium]|nr:Gfo/Idh/MocA family oxidoreductase [Clostridia bacterium]
MKNFRFAIMGAGGIANRFCDAVGLIDGCEICAISSKSMDRAKDFAARHSLPAAYDSYERMLDAEKPDAVYIAVTTDSHFALAKLCIEHSVPVLCEKAMFRSRTEADEALGLSESNGVFAMEAMWSRFLPPVNAAKRWLAEGRIGSPIMADMGIGFRAPQKPDNRYFSPSLGGGASYDLTVYAYEIMTYIIGLPVISSDITAISAMPFVGTPVDAEEIVTMLFEGNVPAVLKSTLLTSPDENLTISGTEGKIVVPRPHVGSEAFLYQGGRQTEHFIDTATKNGFTYEIEEVMRCVRAGMTESPVAPHSMTRYFASLCDRIYAGMIG